MNLDIKVSMNFLNQPVSTKITLGEKVHDGLAANSAIFPDLPVTPVNLQNCTYKMQRAYVAAKDGDKASVLALEAAVAEWDGDFKLTAAYVSYAAQGKAEPIVKVGFTATKGERKRKPRAEMVKNLQAAPSRGKGTCVASCAAERGAKGYVCVAAPEDVKATMNGDTLEINAGGKMIYVKTSGRRTVQLHALASSQPICVTMYAFNSAGSGPLAPSIEMTPQ